MVNNNAQEITTMKHRLSWADNAKALGMILVFLGHFIETPAYAGNDFLLEWYKYIYAFHMPLFFLLAGFFFRPKPIRFGQLFINKMRTRLVPALFFVAITMPLWMHPSWWKMPDSTPAETWEKTWLLLRGWPVANWPCWFLVCLFSVELIASELIPFLEKKLFFLLALPVTYAAGWFLTHNSEAAANLLGIVNGTWFVQEAVMALSFYLLGVGLARYGHFILPTHFVATTIKFVICLIIFVVAVPHIFEGESRASVNMSASAHGDWLWFPVAAITGSLMLIQFAGLFPTSKSLAYIGQNTLPLMGFCGLFLLFFNAVIWRWVPQNISNIYLTAICLAISVGSIAICLPFAAFLNKLFPWLVGK
ncbi:MAG TPA: acyltransferase family protein [Pseudomonadales bacterium]|nr:acyltransferase family protein [Pseudomonadales bacterium]